MHIMEHNYIHNIHTIQHNYVYNIQDNIIMSSKNGIWRPYKT